METAYEWLTENFSHDSNIKLLCISVIDYFAEEENVEAIGEILGGTFDLTDDEIKYLIKLRCYERGI